ncbi:MAG: sensor domain-containing diguanylate cyclase [Gammaproteobacteria bacterium]|nr:sensor domain-containing diguanylate cyclase [Gammaproteobacteria bacterium]
MSNTSEQFIDPQKIIEKKAHILYLQAPISNGTIFLIALIFVILLQEYFQPAIIITWAAMMSLLASYRLFLWYQRKKAADKRTPDSWINHYIIATGLTGLIWGSFLLLPNANSDLALHSVYFIVFFGVTASAVSILPVSLIALHSYTIPLAICFFVALDNMNDSNFLFFAIATGIYYLMLSLFARNNNKQILKSILLQLHNQTLVNQLQEEVEQRELLVKARTQQLVQSNKAVVDSEDRLQNVINGAELGYWDWNYQTGHTKVNNRWLEILGLTHGEINNNISDWESRVHPEDRMRMIATIDDAIKNHVPYVADFRMKHKDGYWVWIQGSGSLVESDTITDEPLRLCGTHQDISYRKQIEKELEYRAKHDYLTDLYNRIELEKRFQEELNRAKRYQHNLSIFMIDIDHFKKINDVQGHQSGDQVLKQFANFLLKTIRATDYVARYGGEEFVMILPETSVPEAEELAERLRIRTTKLAITLKHSSLTITISIGIASYPEHGQSYDKLLEVADSAMYQAKQNGRNRVRSAGS